MSLQDDKQQNIQIELDFSSALTGEAREAGREETEPSGATSGTENPASTNRLMEEVCERENLKAALRQVKANKGSPGVDGMTVGGIKDYLKEHWPAIREPLLNGTYEPKPVRRVEIPKPDGGVRKLGIPTVLDRFIQQAVMQVLQRRWDRTFSDHSYGFRPGRSAHQAVAQAQQYIVEGHGWCVDLDLEKFFDRVNHDKLMGQIAKRVEDKRLLKLIRAFLNAGVMENGLVSPSVEGTPQGGPLSPLLSNLVLNELDRELERRGHRFVRYADDCNIYARSERAGQRVMESVTQFITQKLKLKVNEAKSAVARPQERKFLGFSFTAGHGGTGPVYAGLAQLFRLLRNARGADRLDPLGPVAIKGGFVAAVENTAPSPGGTPGTGGAGAAGEQYRRQRSRPLVPREGQGPVCGAFQCLLQIAWASLIVGGLLA
jgi:RNA-directed DNA polymerase